MGLKNFGHVGQEYVDSARERFLREYYAEDRDSYDQDDIAQIKYNDWTVKRFIIAAYKNEEEACRRMAEAMRWRKENDLRSLTDDMFPREFWATGALFEYEKDRSGVPSLIMRLKFLKRIPEMLDNMKKFCMYQIFKIDNETNGDGWMLVLDFTGCGYSHYQNIDICHYFITTMHSYFPAGMDYVLIVDLPWVLSSFWGFVKMWIPEKRRDMVQFCTKDQLIDYFDLENLPPVLGGQCKRPYKTVPDNSLPAFDMGIDMGLDPSRCEEIYQLYKPLLEECDEEATE